MPGRPSAGSIQLLLAVAFGAPLPPVGPHPLREKLLALIRRIPGVRFSTVWRELQANRGTATYHVQMLERANEIRAVRDRGLTRLYAVQTAPRDQAAFAILWRGRVLEVVRVIIENPSIGQTELTKRLRISRKVLREYVDLLVEQGLLREDRGPHSRRYVATSDLIRLVERVDRGEFVGNAEMGRAAQGGEDHL